MLWQTICHLKRRSSLPASLTKRCPKARLSLCLYPAHIRMFVVLLVLLLLPHQNSACCCCDCCCCDNNAGLGALGMLGALGALCPPGLLGAGGLGGAAGIGLGLNGGLGLGQTIPGINVPPVVGRRKKRLANILQESISQVRDGLDSPENVPAPKLRACIPRNEPSNFNDPKSRRGKRCQCPIKKPAAWN